MSLASGTRLGPYEIVAPIGAGGMGEVYRARDTKLDREVAIKVLPTALAQHPDRLARFEREAKVLAALNHPNIAGIYGLEDRAIVMELVDGPTLADRIRSGAIPLEESLKIAAQIADALEAANEKGVVHRDLKPANVKVREDGTVKVLDFGLATAVQSSTREPGEGANSPTLTMGATEMGVILGTAAYMSPEQAAGKPVDRRADIWSFGVVLWEMLTGKRLFEGETISHTLADVLRAPIDFEKLPKQTPSAIRELLRRCLDRDVKTRLRDIGEARVAISRAGNASEIQTPTESVSQSKLPWIWAAAATVALGALTLVHFRETPPPVHTLRYTVAVPEHSIINSFALSPDGRYVAIAASMNGKLQLWLRALDALQAQPMSGTDDARFPFWSPDSRYIGFFAQGKLKKIAASGGPAQALCDAPDARGGSWSKNDVIVFSPAPTDRAIERISAAGGIPYPVTKTKGSYRFPTFLPSGRQFLYVATGGSPENNGVYISSLDGGENRRIGADTSRVVFASGAAESRLGHLLFVRENTLMAQPFDAGTAQTSGDMFPIAEGVSFTTTPNYVPVTVSNTGLLLYTSGEVAGGQQIVWYDRTGKLLGPVGAPGLVFTPALSPDERSIAFARQVAAVGNADIWLRDLSRGADTRFTFDPSGNFAPFWSPKGDRIVFAANRGGRQFSLYQKSTGGSGQDELLLVSPKGSAPNGAFPTQWSRDGRFIVYSNNVDPKTKFDIWVLPVGDSAARDRKPVLFLQTEFNELHGQLSPDSRWMAYTSDETGQQEVYVRPFPSGDGRWRISIAGGQMPRWRGDGKELFYAAADGKMTAVTVKAVAGPKAIFEAGAPVPLFESHIIATSGSNFVFQYDVSADGKHFLVDSAGAVGDSVPLTVVVNWQAGLKK